jgi:hypothetical protein
VRRWHRIRKIWLQVNEKKKKVSSFVGLSAQASDVCFVASGGSGNASAGTGLFQVCNKLLCVQIGWLWMVRFNMSKKRNQKKNHPIFF